MMIMQLPLSHQTKPLFLQAGLGGIIPWPVVGALSGIKNHLFTSSQEKSHKAHRINKGHPRAEVSGACQVAELHD